MKLLVVLLVILGVGGFAVSWIAAAYSRERRSIERYSQTMDVMQKLSGEDQTPKMPISLAEPKPHIKVLGDRAQALQQPQTFMARQVDPAVIARSLGEKLSARGQNQSAEFGDSLSKTPDAKKPEIPLDGASGPLVPRVSQVRNGVSQVRIAVKAVTTAVVSNSRVATSVLAAVGLVVVVSVGYFSLSRHSITAPSIKPLQSPPTSIANKKLPNPTTTVPNVLTPVSVSSQGATFAAPLGNYTIVISVTSPCWVAQSTSPGSMIVWDATLAAGSSHTISASGPLTIRAGNSTAMSLTLNGVPVKFSSNPGPYDVSFSPSSPGQV